MSERGRATVRHKMLRLTAVLALAAGSLLAATGHATALPVGFAKIGMVCNAENASGNTFDLVANSGYIETPDGNSVFMWSYANAAAPDNGQFQSPGPVLCADEGDTVVVQLDNT